MYKVIVSRKVEKEIDDLPKHAVKRIGKAMDQLAQNPHPQFAVACHNNMIVRRSQYLTPPIFYLLPHPSLSGGELAFYF